MTIEDVREFCLSFPGTSEDMKWGDNLTFMVREKIFAIFSLDANPIDGSFKVDEEDFETLSGISGMRQAPHFAKRQWIQATDLALLSELEWKSHLTKAYHLIKAKLPKKVQAELDGQNK
jgi:predicted DNA-binding protein (MmcQ/YjbR family)